MAAEAGPQLLDVYLQPMEDGGGFVRICLEEVRSYHRFSQSCHWLQNEIMQAESRPLCASDITFQLQKQFAFLPGGRQDGCPIIVFPEFPTFGDLPEEEFHSVLTYLTSVPSLNAAGVGFVLVIDRRLDKWASVKATLLRIAVSYPPCCLPSLSQSVKQFVLSSVKVR
nr:guanine nucleotide exchange factor DBS-like [Paramormyrops kingsleyae]